MVTRPSVTVAARWTGSASGNLVIGETTCKVQFACWNLFCMIKLLDGLISFDFSFFYNK